MTVRNTIKAGRQVCLDAWLHENKLCGWLAENASICGEDVILTSRLPNVSGPHQLVQQTEAELLYDWYVEGCKTKLKVNFEDLSWGTSISIEHNFPAPLPIGVSFPPGEHYGEQVWDFALCQLKSYLENGKQSMKLPWPDDLHTIEHEIAIDTPLDEVWRILTNADLLKRLKLVEVGARIEPKVGGRYSFGWDEAEISKLDGPGYITEWVELERLSYTWYGGRESIISWSLEKVDDSHTKIRFRHTGLIFSYADTWSYKLGWADHLLELKDFLERGETKDTTAATLDHPIPQDTQGPHPGQ